MKSTKLLLPALSIILLSTATARADDTALRQAAKQKAETINQAVIDEDFAAVANLTHSKVVEMLGGREKMIATMEQTTREIKKQGIFPTASKVEEPSGIARAGAEMYLVVPFQIEMKAPGGRIRVNSYLIGVAAEGKDAWRFIDGAVGREKIRQLFPALPDQLKLPDREPPVSLQD